MEKRLGLALAVSASILFGWIFVQQKFFPPPHPEPAPESAAPTPEPPPATPPTAAAPTAPAAGPTAKPEGPHPATPKPKEELATIERPGLYRATFSSWGAAPVGFVLLDPQYKVTVDGKDVPIDLVHSESGAEVYRTSFSSGAPEAERSDFDLPPDAAFTLVRRSDDELLYAADVGTDGRVHVEKKWTFPREGYAIGLELTVENRGSKPLSQHLVVSMGGYQDPSVSQGGGLSFGRRVSTVSGECDVNDKVKRLTWSSGGGCTGGGGPGKWSEAIHEVGDVRWVGDVEQFFITATAFGPSDGLERACKISGTPAGHVSAETVFGARQVAAGGKQVYPMVAFAGPKQLHRLDAVVVGGQPARLGDAVNYGWTLSKWIARPMLAVLKAIQRVVRNWGVAIIFITILLKLVTLYPTQKSMQSMKKMAKLKPKIDAIKARFPDDQMKQNQETMALYRTEGVSPFGSCLPMLIQMPIYIGFYSMLQNAVELYRSSFFGPIKDMTAPYWPMAVATGVLMFAQQRLSPSAADPQQQKMMLYMPVVFMAMTVFLPSGLTLYILTNTVLGMLHQYYLNRSDPDATKPRGGAGGDKSKGKGALKPARA